METVSTYKASNIKEMTATPRGDLRKAIRRVDSIIIAGDTTLEDREKEAIIVDLKNSHLPSVKDKGDYRCMFEMIGRLQDRLKAYTGIKAPKKPHYKDIPEGMRKTVGVQYLMEYEYLDKKDQEQFENTVEPMPRDQFCNIVPRVEVEIAGVSTPKQHLKHDLTVGMYRGVINGSMHVLLVVDKKKYMFVNLENIAL